VLLWSGGTWAAAGLTAVLARPAEKTSEFV
jgi:hypothetical protein